MSRRLVVAGRLGPSDLHGDMWDGGREIRLEVADEKHQRIHSGLELFPKGLEPEVLRAASIWALGDMIHSIHHLLKEES